MTTVPPVRAIRLHGTKILADHDRRVSIFPFFNAEGAVSAHMVTDKEAGKLLFVPHDEALVMVPLAGRPSLGSLRPIDEEALSSVSGLWHYDPWWVLADSPFASHWATPALKETNCVDFLDQDITSVLFARDLSAVTWAHFENGAKVSLQHWSSDFLSQPTSGSGSNDTTPSQGPGWVLDPMWDKN